MVQLVNPPALLKESWLAKDFQGTFNVRSSNFLKMNLKWEPKNETTEKKGNSDLGKKDLFQVF